ncbi:hypothetical protein KW882_05070 [Vibrio parahaemolyticus]
MKSSDKLKEKSKSNVLYSLGNILSGKELSDEAKKNVAKTGFYATAALGAIGGIAFTDVLMTWGEPYSAEKSFEAQSVLMGVGAVATLTARWLKQLSDSINTDLPTRDSVPTFIKSILDRNDIDEILESNTKVAEVMEALPKEHANELKQLAWICAHREQIKSNEASLEHDYDHQGPRPTRKNSF